MAGSRLVRGLLAASLILGFGGEGDASAAAQTAPPPTPAPEIPALELSRPVKRSLAGGQSHSYRISLRAGEFVHVVVEQQGIDVTISLAAPDGTKIAEMDSPNYSFGPEFVSALAAAAGDYLVKVSASEPTSPAGSYEVEVRELHPATDRDRSRAAAQRAYRDAEAQRALGKAESLRLSVSLYEQALTLWRDADDAAGQARALFWLAEVQGRLGNLREEIRLDDQALALLITLREPGLEAATHVWIGLAHQKVGDVDEALSHINRAVAIHEALGDRVAEAVSQVALGEVRQHSGDHQAALANYRRALSIVGSVGDKRAEGITLNNIALILEEVGELDQALECYGRSLTLLRAAGDRRNEAITLSNMGLIYASREDWQKALEYQNLALPLRRQIGDRRGEAYTLNNIALEQARLGKTDEALQNFSRALELRRTVGDRYGEGNTLYGLGELSLITHRTAEALDSFEKALALRRGVLDKRGEAEALFGMARARREQGDLDAARQDCEAALVVVESLRTRVASPLRGSYLATTRKYYDFEIDLLMRLDRRDPDHGFDALALQTSERARARSLLDLLTEARANIREGVDVALLERERSLRQRLGPKVELQSRLLGGKHSDEEAAAAAKDIETLMSELQQVESEIRAASPRYAALTQPEPLTASEIQNLLDEETVLLEYALGEERSYLWAIRRGAIASYELPGRAKIEAAARALYGSWSAPPKPASPGRRDAGAELSQMILAPAGQLLENRRIVVIAEGALQFVPFAALSVPGSAQLLGSHEVLNLPSASTLALMRRDFMGRKQAPRTLIVLADPVFGRDDSRVARSAVLGSSAPVQVAEAKDGALQRSVRDVGEGGAGLGRLPFTRQEARAILRLAAPGSRKEALDFDANRAAATSSDLSQYRIVHFATHGFINTVHPELSGLVLSLVDREGRDLNGFVPAAEFFNLKLSADLVVLSACRTALGREVRGEGLVGLTRAFMYAGSPRVVASLWRVDDAATAEVMRRFYEGMLGPRALRPAAALREAQMAVSKQKRWSDPYYWAGFVLQGEWR